MRRQLRAVIALVSLTLAIFGGIVSTSPSADAVGCTGTACNGKDPKVQGCAGSATTIGEITENSIHVELRYSAACNAAWTRITTPSGWKPAACNTIWGQLWDRDGRLKTIQATCPGSNYTNMLSYSYVLRACVNYADSNATPTPPTGYCTAWH